MSMILRKATEQQQSEWQPVPEGLWRWMLAKPELRMSEKYGNYQVSFTLNLTGEEQKRLTEEHGDPPEGTNQSWRAYYTVGLSLGYVQRDGQYKSTNLVDFLAACLGASNAKKFRDWIAGGGGPPVTKDMSEQEQKNCITDWLGWWEGLEVYGSIRHQADSRDSSITRARFGGPIPIGSMPNQKEEGYQSMAKGKLRAMLAEAGVPQQPKPPEQIQQEGNPTKARTYEEVFETEDDQALPF